MLPWLQGLMFLESCQSVNSSVPAFGEPRGTSMDALQSPVQKPLDSKVSEAPGRFNIS